MREIQGNLTRTVTFTVVDNNGNESEPKSVTVNVTAVNDAPTLTGEGISPPTYEGTDWLTALPLTNVVVADPDNANFNGGRVEASISTSAQADDVLGVKWGNGIRTSASQILYNSTLIGTQSGGSDGAALVIALNANATLAATQALIRQTAFRNSGNDPGSHMRSITVLLSDGGVAE